MQVKQVYLDGIATLRMSLIKAEAAQDQLGIELYQRMLENAVEQFKNKFFLD